MQATPAGAERRRRHNRQAGNEKRASRSVKRASVGDATTLKGRFEGGTKSGVGRSAGERSSFDWRCGFIGARGRGAQASRRGLLVAKACATLSNHAACQACMQTVRVQMPSVGIHDSSMVSVEARPCGVSLIGKVSRIFLSATTRLSGTTARPCGQAGGGEGGVRPGLSSCAGCRLRGLRPADGQRQAQKLKIQLRSLCRRLPASHAPRLLIRSLTHLEDRSSHQPVHPYLHHHLRLLAARRATGHNQLERLVKHRGGLGAEGDLGKGTESGAMDGFIKASSRCLGPAARALRQTPGRLWEGTGPAGAVQRTGKQDGGAEQGGVRGRVQGKQDGGSRAGRRAREGAGRG